MGTNFADSGFSLPQRFGFGDDRERHARVTALAQRVYSDREIRVMLYDDAFVNWVGGTLLYLPKHERLEAVLTAMLGESNHWASAAGAAHGTIALIETRVEKALQALEITSALAAEILTIARGGP